MDSSDCPFKIIEITEVTPDLLVGVASLLRLLSEAPAPSLNEMAEIISSSSSKFLGGFYQGHLAGMLTLVSYRTPTGLRSVIEDVVVATEFRRQGLGTQLTHVAIKNARESGARTISLTSSPKRMEAKSMYAKLDFETRCTKVYRIVLGGG